MHFNCINIVYSLQYSCESSIRAFEKEKKTEKKWKGVQNAFEMRITMAKLKWILNADTRLYIHFDLMHK